MDEPFELPVNYKDKELMFPAQLLNYGYTHKFKIDIEDTEVFFEPDEEGKYRALANPALLEEKRNISGELLQAVADAIETILK